jgi:hypothetical protein
MDSLIYYNGRAALWAADLERDQDTLRNKKILEDVNPLES